MTLRLVVAGALFGVLFAAAMAGLILITGGTGEQVIFLGTPLAIGSAIAFTYSLRRRLGSQVDIAATEKAFRRAWRQLSPVVLVGVAGVVGMFVFEGWANIVCGVLALVATIFIARRLQKVIDESRHQ